MCPGDWRAGVRETTHRGAGYIGDPDVICSINGDPVAAAARGSQKSCSELAILTARHERHCVQTFPPLSIASEFAEPAATG